MQRESQSKIIVWTYEVSCLLRCNRQPTRYFLHGEDGTKATLRTRGNASVLQNA